MKSTRRRLGTLALTFSLALAGVACGDDTTETTAGSGGSGAGATSSGGAGSGGASSGGASASGGASTGGSGATSTGGASTGGSGAATTGGASSGGASSGGASTGGTGTGGATGGACPDRVFDSSECLNGGACCNDNDKCLLNKAPGEATSPMDDAVAPCEVGCAFNTANCLPCINGNLANNGTQITTACGDCYAALISCSASSCALQCIDSGSQGCRGCVFSNCIDGSAGFNACSGLNSDGS